MYACQYLFYEWIADALLCKQDLIKVYNLCSTLFIHWAAEMKNKVVLNGNTQVKYKDLIQYLSKYTFKDSFHLKYSLYLSR